MELFSSLHSAILAPVEHGLHEWLVAPADKAAAARPSAPSHRTLQKRPTDPHGPASPERHFGRLPSWSSSTSSEWSRSSSGAGDEQAQPRSALRRGGGATSRQRLGTSRFRKASRLDRRRPGAFRLRARPPSACPVGAPLQETWHECMPARRGAPPSSEPLAPCLYFTWPERRLSSQACVSDANKSDRSTAPFF